MHNGETCGEHLDERVGHPIGQLLDRCESRMHGSKTAGKWSQELRQQEQQEAAGEASRRDREKSHRAIRMIARISSLILVKTWLNSLLEPKFFFACGALEGASPTGP